MKKYGYIILLALAAGAPTGASAQSAHQTGKAQRQSFEQFRQGLLNDYKDFRQKLLDNYSDFLNGEWHEYESYNGVRRDSKPKPAKAPRMTPATPSRPTTPPQPTTPEHMTKPADLDPAAKPSPRVTPTPAPKPGPEPEPVHSPAETPKVSAGEFSFYGIPVKMPAVKFQIADRLYANNDYAAQWRALQDASVAERLVPKLKALASSMGLNDFLTYRLVNDYITFRFPTAHSSSRLSAIHYLLANMGYDVRIATTADGDPLLLIPTVQTIYSRSFMNIGDRKYYVFEPDGYDMRRAAGKGIRTCRLPEDADAGGIMDLVLGELKLPAKPKAFDLEYGPIHLTGEVNENLMPVLYRYPQMPVESFARSEVQPALRRSLVRQLQSQLADLPGDEQVEKLLSFMHNAFDYATDQEFHGFEKPYFLEESLYYPKNDCEDRAIFYTWFLWNALGKEAQLISFPGHEAATVRLDTPIQGTAYSYGGETFYISDPTFIGSSTGIVMPMFRGVDPKVDYTFK